MSMCHYAMHIVDCSVISGKLRQCPKKVEQVRTWLINIAKLSMIDSIMGLETTSHAEQRLSTQKQRCYCT